MKKNDLYISSILTVFGIYIAFEGYRLELGVSREPQPGFMIFWAGILLVCLSIALFAEAYFSRKEELKDLWKEIQWTKVLKLMSSLIVFTIVFEWIGFFLSSFFLLLFLLKGLESQRWWVALTVAVVTILLCYIVFVVLLEVRFPVGHLGRIFGGLRS